MTRDVLDRYEIETPYLQSAKRRWQKRLRPTALGLDRAALFDGRIKSYWSVLGKLKNPDKPKVWDQLGDLVAFKAVFPTLEQVEEFSDWLLKHDRWNPDLEDKKCLPAELGYTSKQFDLCSENICDSSGKPLKIEVQVRTLAVDAWYVLDHRLLYKSFVDLDNVMRRKLNRLTVLTELFDEEVRAVVEHRNSAPEYGRDRLYEALLACSITLTNRRSATTRPSGLLDTLLDVEQDDPDELIPLAQEFVHSHEPTLATIFAAHLPMSDTYVESYDWLYQEPEAVLIALLATTRPRELKARVKSSNYATEINEMMGEFSGIA